MCELKIKTGEKLKGENLSF